MRAQTRICVFLLGEKMIGWLALHSKKTTTKTKHISGIIFAKSVGKRCWMELDASLNAGQHDPSLPHRKHVQERHMDVVYLVVVYRNCQECAFSSFKLNPFARLFLSLKSIER